MKQTKIFYVKLVIFSLLTYLITVACQCGIFIPECTGGSTNQLGKIVYNSLNDISRISNGNYLAVTDSGEIYSASFTEQGELTTSLLYTVPGNPSLFDIGYLPNSNITLIVGTNGLILRNVGGSLEWANITSQVNKDLNRIYIQSEEAIYIVGDTATILKSIDLGITWQKLSLGLEINSDLLDVNGTTSSVFVCGDNYTFYKSKDGGETWGWTGLGKRLSTKSEFGYNRIFFYDDSLGYAGGPHGLVLKTTDGGTYWTPTYLENFDEVNDLYFMSPEMGGLVGPNGTTRFTTDGGESWFEDTTVTSYIAGREIKRIVPFGRDYGTVLGTEGLTTFIAPDLSYLDSIVITSVEHTDLTINEFRLYQSYPNPFNPTTKIRYSIPVGTQSAVSVQLKVYDILGRQAVTLVNGERHPGAYEVEFNASSLPSGVYFYRLTSGSFNVTKKFVLLK
jgi:photosystem II stability/assembly factor-like uncharacterized protein